MDPCWSLPAGDTVRPTLLTRPLQFVTLEGNPKRGHHRLDPKNRTPTWDILQRKPPKDPLHGTIPRDQLQGTTIFIHPHRNPYR